MDFVYLSYYIFGRCLIKIRNRVYYLIIWDECIKFGFENSPWMSFNKVSRELLYKVWWNDGKEFEFQHKKIIPTMRFEDGGFLLSGLKP